MRGRYLWTHLGKLDSCDLLLLQLRCFDETGAAFFAQAVTVAADRDHLAVMEEAIEDGGRHDRIAEYGAPFAHGAVTRNHQAAALVAARDELEEQVCCVGLERQIAELVDDQQLGVGEVAEPLFQAAFECALASAATSVGAVMNSTE